MISNNLDDSKLWVLLLEHLKVYFKDLPDETYEIETSFNADEHQFYIRSVGFSFVHLKKWLEQLEYAKEFVKNFEYKSTNCYTRFDHLYYNYENYIIRYQSTKDRILQLINSVFHLCIADNNVNEKNVLSNLQVKHYQIDKLVYKMKSFKVYEKERNEIIHVNSLLDKQLRKLDIYYSVSNPEERFKLYRTELLKNEIKNVANLMNRQTILLINDIIVILDSLFPIYQRIEKQLR